MREEKEDVNQEEQLILVGFGKNKLSDMLKWIDTDQEVDLIEAWKKWPPVWRRQEICSTGDIMACMQFLAYSHDLVAEWENNESNK